LAATIVGTLALGIAVTAAIFGVIQGFLLRPPPFPEPDRLVELTTVSAKPGGNEMGLSPLDAADYAADAASLAALGIHNTERINLVRDGAARSILWTRVSPGFFRALGVAPQLGDVFSPEDDEPGGDVHQVVLSDRLWRDSFGADRSVLGETVETAMGRHRIVGVMPPGFRYPDRSDLWITIQSYYEMRSLERTDPAHRTARTYAAVARLTDGATLAQARQELAGIGRRLETTYPVTNEAMSPRVTPLAEARSAPYGRYLALLGVAAGLVLVICCANVANLLLVRAEQRTQELTVRAALGASRRRLARMLLGESLSLALAGGVAGAALGAGLLALFPLVAPAELPAWVDVRLDLGVLAFTFAVAALTGLLFGLAPLSRVWKLSLAPQLRGGGRGSSGRSSRLRQALVVSELGLSLALALLGGLLLKSLDQIERIDLGFEQEQTVTLRLTAFQAGTNERRIRAVTDYYQRAMDRLRALPGVVAVGATDNFPFSGSRYNSRADRDVEARGEDAFARSQRGPTLFVDCSPGYFDAMGIPLLEGRDFREDDDLDAPMVITLSRRTADRLFPGQSALGREVRVVSDGSVDDEWARVVGVVGNVMYDPREGEEALELYYPYKQYGFATTTIAVRTRGAPEGFAATAAKTVTDVDPTVAVEKVETMSGLVEEQLWQERLWSLLVICFAALTLVLAATGVFGVMSYSVLQRRREIGVRTALGAGRQRVLGLIVGEGFRLVALGGALGLALLPALYPLVSDLLFDVGAADPPVVLGAAGLLAAVGLLACAIPAWRAASIDPAEALRD